MSTYVRAAANLIIDKPHADGMLTQEGVGRDWPATEPKEETFAFTPDVGAPYTWCYRDVCEYVDRLKAIAPIRTFTRGDMALTDWTLSTLSGEDQWKLSSRAAHSRYRMLHMFDAAISQYSVSGHVPTATTVSAAWGPNLQFWVWRGGRPKGETDPCLFAIHLRPTTGIEYALVFPAQQEGGKYHSDNTGITDALQTTPFLMGLVPGEAYWTIITRKQGGASPTIGAVGSEARLEVIRIEYDDGFMLVRTGERDKGWVFGGKWTSYGGTQQTFALEPCRVEVRVLGHTAMFGMNSLYAPLSAAIWPRDYLQLPSSDYNQTPQYKKISYEPAGTSITVAADAHPSNALWIRPKATFATTANGSRPLLYCIQEYRTATVGSADSVPVDTFGNDNFKLLELSGQVSATWRGSSITAKIRANPGHDLGDVAPNAKITAIIGANNAEGVAFTMFTGYVPPPEKEMLGGAQDAGAHHAKLEATLQAYDIVEARLARKDLLWHCSYEGWTEKAAFEHILNRCGVPAALISVDAACVNILPSATARGARRYKFAPDAKAPQALQSIADAFGRRWGVRRDGVVFLEPRYTHVTGHYDYTLDYLTTDPSWVQTHIKYTRTLGDFANFLQVLVGEGPDATARIIADRDSMWTPGTAAFIGDIWTRFVSYPDAADINAIATELWREIGYWQTHIEFSIQDHPLLWPDDELLLSIPTSVCPAGSIFRILGKSWSVDRDGRFRQTIQAVRVE